MVLTLIQKGIRHFMGIQPKRNQPSQQLESFDFLRAIFAVVVVALHANLLNVFLGKPILSSISDILNLNLGYLAVPVFLQISLFLFFLKNKKSDHQYFIQRRLPKIISLYLFWVTLRFVFDSFLMAKPVIDRLKIESVWQLIEFFASGGYTIFYFFFALLFVTFIADLFMALMGQLKTAQERIRVTYFLLGVSCVLVFFIPIIDIICGNEVLTHINNPFVFLPYVFTTAIIIQEFNQGKLNVLTPSLKLGSLAALFLLLMTLE